MKTMLKVAVSAELINLPYSQLNWSDLVAHTIFDGVLTKCLKSGEGA